MMRINFKRIIGLMLALCMVLGLGGQEKAKAATTTQKTLELNQYYTEVWEENETKLYQFTVPQAGNINIEIKNTDPVGKQEVKASLYDSNNAEVIGAYHGANVTLPTYSSDANRTFYLKVSDYNAAWKTSYTVTIYFQPTADWETENNDTTATADVIAFNQPYNGMVNSDHDSCDYYKLYVPGNRKVSITFGPAMVDGVSRKWTVYLLSSKNESAKILETGTRQTYTTYLKKGTYYLKVVNESNTKNIQYAFVCSAKTFKIKKPKIKSLAGTAYKGWFDPNYVIMNKIKIKNSGDCQGYQVLVAKKKNMKGRLVDTHVDLTGDNSKGEIGLGSHMGVYKKYYAKLRGYVKDPFGNKIYGKYSKVKCKKTKKSTYDAYKN